MLDSPTNNFCTFNPLYIAHTSYTWNNYAEGNLRVYPTDNWASQGTLVPAELPSGKAYFEVYIDNVGSTTRVGVYKQSAFDWQNEVTYQSNGNKLLSGSHTSYGATYTTGDIIGVAVNIDSSSITFYKNNSSQGSITLPSLSEGYAVGISTGGPGSYSIIANFGQDSSFAGNKTAQGNQDSNSIGDFYYEPPTDFLALCTSNLPDPAVIPSEHFNTVLYTGDGSSSQAQTGVGFQPDLVWVKKRSATDDHCLVDAVRGVNNYLKSNVTAAEGTSSSTINALSTDGFTVGASGIVGDNGATYVAWNWKAGGTGVSNTNGSINSTVSANADAGFSIVSYTGTGSNATIGHGLSKAPEMVIVKGRNQVSHWMFGSDGLTSWVYSLKMDNTSAESSDATKWNSTAPTSSVFNVGTEVFTGGSGKTFIAYCFHSVDGYSKMGSYTGNGITDGTFVYTGFRPAYVMIKRASGGVEMWNVFDDARSPYNLVNDYIKANDAGAENVNHTTLNLDFTSNGFKVRGTNTGINTSWATYIFLAFAEQPFKHSNAR